MTNLTNGMIIQKIVWLAQEVERLTGLTHGHDFHVRSLPKTRTINPAEQALVEFSGDKMEIPVKREAVITAVRDLKLTTKDFPDVKKQWKQFYTSLPENTPLPGMAHFTTVPASKKSAGYPKNEKLEMLIKLHHQLLILGVANRDQPDLAEGLAHFNYIDTSEMKRAAGILHILGIVSDERKGKGNNLTFMLEFDDNINAAGKQVPRRAVEEKGVINAVVWIIEKIFRKRLIVMPVAGDHGMSYRSIADANEAEMIKIKKYLAERHDIIILIEGSKNNRSEFFVLITERAKNIYHSHGAKLIAKELLVLLKDENTIITNTNTNTNTNTETKMNETKTLTGEIRRILTEAGIASKPKKGTREMYLLLHNEAAGTKIEVVYGETQDKVALILRSEKAIKAAHPAAEISKNKSGSMLTVSIKGYESIPGKRGARKPKTKRITQIAPSRFMDSISTDQKNLLIQELGLGGQQDIGAILEKVGEDFFFLNKKNPMAKGLLAGSFAGFANASEVIKTVGKKIKQ